LQSRVPPEMQGRVFATQNSLVWAMGPLGLALLGPLADEIGVRPLFLLDGGAFLLVALTWALTPRVRNLEDEPATQPGLGDAGMERAEPATGMPRPQPEPAAPKHI
jgi:hypothetical protein